MRKEKAIVAALIGTMVLLPQAFGMFPTSAQATNVISVTYQFDESEILRWLDTGQYMKNNRIQRIAGEPLVPYRIANILLPPYTEVAGVSVPAKIGGKHFVKDLPCGQPPVAIGEEPKTVQKNPAIYNSDELYPRKVYRIGSMNFFRGYNILHVRLYPVQYKPASKLATYYTEMTVYVELKTGNKMDTFRNLVEDREMVERLVDNPEISSTYDSTFGARVQTLGTSYEYIIVTTPDLEDEFQVLADWKGRFVDGAKVVTVNVGANETVIKDKIKYYYDNYNTSYVLLGGDVNVITSHAKMVGMPPQGKNITEDFWFANFDEDPENISYYEVYIGRAPVDNETEATNFVNKVIAYEQMEKPKANLFHQSRIEPGNKPDSRELAWQCMQYVPAGYTNHKLFEEDKRIGKTDWINFWRKDGIMCEHIGHGDNTSYKINYEVGGGPVDWSNADVSSLDNTFWPVHTSTACFSGQFTVEDCLAEAYVKDPDNGAIACFMNDKEGWYDTEDATYLSGDFIEMQFHALYQEGYENIGAILAHSKYHFIDEATNPSNPDRVYWEWCWREINLIGDPETPVLTGRPALTVLAEDQYGNNLTTGYVCIDGKYRGCTGSTFTVSAGTHTVWVSDFWEAGQTGYRYIFQHWEDNSTDNPRTITVVEDKTIKAHFNKTWCEPVTLPNWSFELRDDSNRYGVAGYGVRKCPPWNNNNGGKRDLAGDIDGDGDCDVDDIFTYMARAYGSKYGDPNYDWRCDLDGDLDVDADDMYTYAGPDYGKLAHYVDGKYSWYTSGGGDYQMWQWLDNNTVQAIAGKTVVFSFWFYPKSVVSDGSRNTAGAEIYYEYDGGNNTVYGVCIGPTKLGWWNAYAMESLPSTITKVKVTVHGKPPNFQAWVDLAQLCLIE